MKIKPHAGCGEAAPLSRTGRGFRWCEDGAASLNGKARVAGIATQSGQFGLLASSVINAADQGYSVRVTLLPNGKQPRISG